ncbi:MAG: NYN domain-containing protein [Egibacteraceae bacterium]
MDEAVFNLRRACWSAVLARVLTFYPGRQQKGVDTLVTLDLVRLAQRNAYDTAILIAGDRDLAEAIRTAQDSGKASSLRCLLVSASRKRSPNSLTPCLNWTKTLFERCSARGSTTHSAPLWVSDLWT